MLRNMYLLRRYVDDFPKKHVANFQKPRTNFGPDILRGRYHCGGLKSKMLIALRPVHISIDIGPYIARKMSIKTTQVV